MKAGKRVKKKDLGVGFYFVFNSDQGVVYHIKVVDDPTYGLIVWGLSRWKGVIGYRTLGLNMADWVGRQSNKKAKFYTDIDWVAACG